MAAVGLALQDILTDVLIYCLKNDFCTALRHKHLFLFRMTEGFKQRWLCGGDCVRVTSHSLGITPRGGCPAGGWTFSEAP